MKRRAASFVLFVLASLMSSHSARAARPIIEGFDATVEEGRRVRFEWTVYPDRPDEQLSCILDVDADDPALVDLSITNCGEQTHIDWTYAGPGTYDAALTVTSSAGGSERLFVPVVVE